MKIQGRIWIASFLIISFVSVLIIIFNRHRKPVISDFDKPVAIETLEKEASNACNELKKRQIEFDQRFPTDDSQKNNDIVLESKEWKELMRWTEACNEAKDSLAEGKKHQ